MSVLYINACSLLSHVLTFGPTLNLNARLKSERASTFKLGIEIWAVQKEDILVILWPLNNTGVDGISLKNLYSSLLVCFNLKTHFIARKIIMIKNMHMIQCIFV